MAERLRLNNEELRTKLNYLVEQLEAYRGTCGEVFGDEINDLEVMNSEFSAKFVTMLKNLKDENKEVTEVIDEALKKAQEILDEFEELDRSAAAEME